MNKEKVLGIIRAVVAALGGYAVGKGYFDSATANEITGAVMIIATAAWSVASKKEPQE